MAGAKLDFTLRLISAPGTPCEPHPHPKYWCLVPSLLENRLQGLKLTNWEINPTPFGVFWGGGGAPRKVRVRIPPCFRQKSISLFGIPSLGSFARQRREGKPDASVVRNVVH